jgi:hypothetical protein
MKWKACLSNYETDMAWCHSYHMQGFTVWCLLRQPGVAIAFVAVPPAEAAQFHSMTLMPPKYGGYFTATMTVRQVYGHLGGHTSFGPECAWPRGEVA